MSSVNEFGEGDSNDFSCYISINNHTRSDLGLINFGTYGEGGEWPRSQPLNTIEAGSSGRVHLKDKLGTDGSEGFVEFEVRLQQGTKTFKLEFADPTGWKSNYLRLRNGNNDGVLSFVLNDSGGKGHPFYGTVDVFETGYRPSSTPMEVDSEHQRRCTGTQKAKADNSVRANYDIGFDAPGEWFDKSPIHESIVIAALIRSKVYVPRATNYNNLNPKQWEYARGLVWNDDPTCLLFEDEVDSNNTLSSGATWAAIFKAGNAKHMIQRSHFGNLQFLHAMASEIGENPYVTRKALIDWMGVMYKLACGNQGVSDQQKLRQHLPKHFDDNTTPTGDHTLYELLLATTQKYRRIDVQKRALGSCLHTIADSYAIGHTQRRLLNRDDYQGRDDKRFYKFRPGMYGRWGPVVTFHSYKDQSDHHAHYDGLPEGQGLPVPQVLDSFNDIIGARDAINACTRLIDFWAEKKDWDGGVRQFLETDVFALDKEARDSDNGVDQEDPLFAQSFAHTSRPGDAYDVEYHAGLQRKLAGLDAQIHTGLVRRQHTSLWRLAGLFVISVLSFLCTRFVVSYFKR
ncbi:hypothetical protein GGR57DRAFT_511814 [Xylariaceae sp. FL1272]|nr:hypothetical protein GGR57DRAFT_511814 [Xylariaceae sp. FL1272]